MQIDGTTERSFEITIARRSGEGPVFCDEFALDGAYGPQRNPGRIAHELTSTPLLRERAQRVAIRAASRSERFHRLIEIRVVWRQVRAVGIRDDVQRVALLAMNRIWSSGDGRDVSVDM